MEYEHIINYKKLEPGELNVSTQCLKCLSKISILFSDYIGTEFSLNGSQTGGQSNSGQMVQDKSFQDKSNKLPFISLMNYFYVQRDNTHDFVLRQAVIRKLKRSIVVNMLYGEELLVNELLQFFVVCAETQSAFINVLMEDIIKEEHWKRIFDLTEKRSFNTHGNMVLLLGNIFKNKIQYKKLITLLLTKYNKETESFLKNAIGRFTHDMKEMYNNLRLNL